MMRLRRNTHDFQGALHGFLSLIRGVLIFFSSLLSCHIVEAASSLVLSQFPLKLATPVHPQVLIAIGNSESMDGNLSGAMMVGSGVLSSSLNTLYNSSSPVNYAVPTGFTPPMQAADGSGNAPYTVSQGNVLYDNSASRLNVAKGGISTILSTYMQTTDFALEVYNTSSSSLYTTWVYYMSVIGANFNFTSTQTTGNQYVINPCFGYTSASSTIKSNCGAIDTVYSGSSIATFQYLQIGSSSDDPTINDVLYTSGLPGVFLSYNGPSPASPYPPNFSLSSYNNGNVFLSYSKTSPNAGSFGTGPTNAGFVPFSPQVMYAQRGFGYGASQSATSGSVIVPMTTAGVVPTASSITTAINTFLPFLNPETNSKTTTEIKSLAGQSPVAGLLTTAKTYLTSLTASACPPLRYVLLISDGLPTADLQGKAWPPLGSAAATGYGVTATFNADGSLASTNDRALTDAISAITNLSAVGIKTYVIGLGAGVQPTVNPSAAASLTAMAIAGGTLNYYPATDPVSMAADLNNILISLLSGSMSTTAAAVSSTNLQAGTVEFQSSFSSSDTLYQDWTGNIIEEALNISTGYPVGTIIWSAQALLDLNTSRIIATWDPTKNSGVGDGIPFEWTNLNTTQQGQLQPSDALGSSRLSYLRGSTALEKRNGGTFRNRTHILGDVVDSKPAYVGTPSSPYFVTSSSYLSFALSNLTRQGMLYVGANDGLLHAFNASTGAEQFAFVPNAVFSNLYNLTNPLYNQSHLFFVDGSPQSGDVQFSDASWHTLLVGGENAGGKSIYAIDVTNPTGLNSETNLSTAVLWEFTDSSGLGYSYSQPQLAQITTTSTTTNRFAVFFGNGYNSTANSSILYALDPQTGQTLVKLDLCAAVAGACNASLPQGLSTVAVAQQNGLQTSPITQVYAGDLQGNLWAVDVSNASPSLWRVRLLFQAKDASGTRQPITTAPLVTLNPNYPRNQGLFVMFGTGQFLTQSDVTGLQIQSIYGVWDSPNLSTVLSRSNLQPQVLTSVSAATAGLPQSIITATTNPVNWVAKNGWYADLPVAGQRVINESELFNGAFITTLVAPPATTCSTPTSVFLSLNYATGGAFSTPQLDITGSGTISAADKYQGANPVGLGLISGYASSPVTLANQSGVLTHLITMSTGQQVTLSTPNVSSRQAAWWQLQ